MIDPRDILGVASDAPLDEIRAAYVRKVKEFPPEQSPEEFERIRDAYDALRDPRARAKAIFRDANAARPLASLARSVKPRRTFAGPRLWRGVLKSK